MIQFNKIIDEHNKDMRKINHQRQWWLVASSIVYIGIILLIFGWDWITDIHQKSIWWVIISITLLVCIHWWYWTMTVIGHLMEHQQKEVQIIKELLQDIKELQHIISSIDNGK